MKVKKIILFIILLSCWNNLLLFGEIDCRDEEDICNDVTNEATKEIQEKFPVFCCGSGGAGLGGVTRTTFLAFQLTRLLTIEQARFLAVAWMEILSKHLNGSKELRPFLVEYPFPPSCIEFSCFVYRNEKLTNHEGDLTIFSIRKGKIRYETHISSTDWKLAKMEDYEEAKQIVLKELQEKGYKPQDLISYAQSIIPPPSTVDQLSFWEKTREATLNAPFLLLHWVFSHLPHPKGKQYPKYLGGDEFVGMCWTLDEYGTQVAKKEDMQFYLVSNVTSSTEPNPDYFLAFFDSHTKTLPEGRILASSLAQDFWKMVTTSPEVQCYQDDNRKFYINNSYYKDIFTEKANMNQVGFKIAYWDKNVERPQAPYLAEIRFIGGVLHYYEADPQTQALHLIFQESYDQAIAFLQTHTKS